MTLHQPTGEGSRSSSNLVGEVKFTEGPNSAGDIVWMTALVMLNNKVIDLGTVIDNLPDEAQRTLINRRVRVTLETIDEKEDEQ
mgnify:CR=1 FL=1